MPPPFSEADILRATEVLEALAEDRVALAPIDPALRQRLSMAAGRLSRPERDEQRQLARALRKKRRKDDRAHDEAARRQTALRATRELPSFPTPRPPGLPRTFGPYPDNPSVPPGEPGPPDLPAEAEAPETPALAPPSPSAPPDGPEATGPQRLRDPRKCYVCKVSYETLHFFYDQLCPACGDVNFAKRTETADLSGRIAIVTGARVKIGYQAAVKLLRAGATVLVTTRFPHDAAARFAREEDHGVWKDRLQIYGLDLRHTPSVERFARTLTRTLPRLDFLVHNACQTVRRPPGFYAHLMETETLPFSALPGESQHLLRDYEGLRASGDAPRLAAADPDLGLRAPALLTQIAAVAGDNVQGGAIFPDGRLDPDGQQIDLRTVNSWRLRLSEVPTVELFEVTLVNAIAPFVLTARLKPLMTRDATDDRHVVNVSAMEGQFYRAYKTDKHPHTNMAKAALNMMTRTSAADYKQSGIHMNSVDTGWVTDEDPAEIAARKVEEHRFAPPLDIVDGAARITDPIIHGFRTGQHVWGLFLKDYKPTPW